MFLLCSSQRRLFPSLVRMVNPGEKNDGAAAKAGFRSRTGKPSRHLLLGRRPGSGARFPATWEGPLWRRSGILRISRQPSGPPCTVLTPATPGRLRGCRTH